MKGDYSTRLHRSCGKDHGLQQTENNDIYKSVSYFILIITKLEERE